jgi:hypothetical protein
VNVIGHEAIPDELYPIEAQVLPQQFKVDRPIGIAVQDEVPPVPTLRYMVWHIDGNDTVESSYNKETISAITWHRCIMLLLLETYASGHSRPPTRMKNR